MSFKSEALVARGPFSEGKWAVEPVMLRELRPDEVLVEMVASGICHTDIHCGNTPADAGVPSVYYPRVLGHEGRFQYPSIRGVSVSVLWLTDSTGSGYVVQVGSAVTKAKAGDAVLLSFSYCGECYVCQTGPRSHCVKFFDINFMGEPVFSDADGSSTIGGRFFGQSSLARHSVVSDKSIVNVSGLGLSRDELKILAPLGCGFQTGSGTVVNVAKAKQDDVLTIAGMGGVGLAAVMAARNSGCRAIIGIDRVEARLELARSLGATHTINSTGLSADELTARIIETAEGLGSTVSIDTTAYPPVVDGLIRGSRYMGRIIQVGTGMPEAHIAIHMQTFMVSAKQYFGAVQGHANTEEYIPQMVGWWRQGVFPVEKLVTFFPYTDYQEALKSMGSGSVVKPVIVW